MHTKNYIFKNDSSGSYIVYKNLDGIIKYQLEIISLNSMPGLLPVKVIEDKKSFEIQYNITSKQNLKDFTKQRILSKTEFLEILSRITGIILDSKNYLLHDTCFPFDIELVFINPLTLDIMFPYIPIKRDINLNKYFRDFMNIFIINHVMFEENNDTFLQKILNELKKDDFTITSFNHIIHKIKHSDLKIIEEEVKLDLHERAEKIHGYNITPIIWLVISQITIISLIALSIYLVSPSPNNLTSTLFGFIILFIVIDYFLYMRIFKKLFKKIKLSSFKSVNVNSIKDIVNYPKDTVLLNQNYNGNPKLKSIKSPVEIIEINKPSFLIGRLNDHVDYVSQNPSLGKIHAEVLLIKNCYFIKDLNSKNGSYINNIKIDSNINYELHNNDSVTLANIEYIFLMPEVINNN